MARGRPEKFTAEQVEHLLKTLGDEGKIKADVTYSRAELQDLFLAHGINEDEKDGLFAKFRSLAQDTGQVGRVRVSYEGNRRGRRYGFSELEEVKERSSAAPAPNAAGSESSDHPEDRVHLASHVALVLARRAIGLSMPKVSGARSRGNVAHSNPDYIGIKMGRRVSPLGVRVPDWIESHPATSKDQVIAAEIKSSITSSNELSSAIRQARHNCRYFDEAWLVAQIPQSLNSEASELGEEYNVGVLSVDSDAVTRPDVLWTPRPTANRLTPREFLSRYDAETLRDLLHKLEACRRLAEALTERLREQILVQLITDQRADSLVTRLPLSIQESLKASTWGGVMRLDVDSFAAGVRSALFDAFEYDAPEESDPGQYLEDMRLVAHLSTGSGILSKETRIETRKALVEFISQRQRELESFKLRIGCP